MFTAGNHAGGEHHGLQAVTKLSMEIKPAIENGTIATLCRMCDTRCSINVHIRKGVLREITPGQINPVNAGRMCPRGKAAIDVFYHPDRILTPLKRRGDGSFMPISRDQALAEITRKIQFLRAKYGARSLAAWKGEGVGFFQQEAYVRRFVRGLGSPNYFSNDSVCFSSRYLGNLLVTGFWSPFPNFARARLILLLGTNPPVCHPPFMRSFADAREKGARLVVIDPRLNPIGCRADIFAQPQPGTDGALLWGLIRALIRAGEYDRAFVEQYTVGFAEAAAYAERFTPEYVEQASGIYASVVRAIARLLMENRPEISVYAGAGLEHYENGVNSIRTLVILATLCGTVDSPCGLYWPENPPLADLALAREEPLLPKQPIGAGRYPVLYDLARECHTMTAMDYMEGKGDYPLKGLLITAANPVITNPNTRRVAAALAKLDLLVVNDLFMTRTARLAHYILPAATFLERTELHLNLEYQRLYLTRPAARIDGVGTEYELWRDLAQRLGFAGEYFPWPDEPAVCRHMLAPTDISFQELEAHPEGVVYAPLRYRKYKRQPLPTPSGRVEFYSTYLKEHGLPALPEYIPPRFRYGADDDYPLMLTTGGRMTLLYQSRHQNIPRFRLIHPRAEVEIHPDNAQDLGIVSGDLVRVVSATGELELAAKVVHKAELLKGTVEIYHGWEEWPANLLTPDTLTDPISGFPLLKSIPVRVEKVSGDQAAQC